MLTRAGEPDRQRGQILVAFAIAFALLLFGLTAMVTDVAKLYVESDRAGAAAQYAAGVGAGDVDLTRYRLTGVLSLDTTTTVPGGPPAFARHCQDAGNQAASAGGVASTTCSQEGNLVTATVRIRIAMPIALFSSTTTVQAQHQAAPVLGTTQPR